MNTKILMYLAIFITPPALCSPSDSHSLIFVNQKKISFESSLTSPTPIVLPQSEGQEVRVGLEIVIGNKASTPVVVDNYDPYSIEFSQSGEKLNYASSSDATIAPTPSNYPTLGPQEYWSHHPTIYIKKNNGEYSIIYRHKNGLITSATLKNLDRIEMKIIYNSPPLPPSKKDAITIPQTLVCTFKTALTMPSQYDP